MATGITALESDTVSRAMQVSKKVLDEIHPLVTQLDTIYNSAGGVKETITQAELDSIPAWSGLTKQQLDDGMYALTASLLQGINAAKVALTQLAARV